MTNTMDTIPAAVRDLSNASDRYLFLLVLIVLGAFGWNVLQRLLKLHEQQKAETQKAQEASNEVRARWETSSDRFAVAIERNTAAFNAASQSMLDCKVIHAETQELIRKFQGQSNGAHRG